MSPRGASDALEQPTAPRGARCFTLAVIPMMSLNESKNVKVLKQTGQIPLQ